MQIHYFAQPDTTTHSAMGLFWRFSQMRRETFVDEYGWDVPTIQGGEYDQYDLPFASYIFAVENGGLIAGARLIRTDNHLKIADTSVTYMIRDATEKRLSNIPSDICYQRPPIDEATWELSRLLSPRNPKAGIEVIKAANNFIRDRGGKRCVFLGSPAFARFGKQAGIPSKRIGPIIKSPTISPYCAMEATII